MTEGQTDSMQDVGERSPMVPGASFHAVTGMGLGPQAEHRFDERDLDEGVIARVAKPAIEPVPSHTISAVLELALESAGAALDSYLDAVVARGMSLEHVFLRLFQPVACRLGDLWSEDIRSFVDVTLAMSQLQRSLRRLTPAFQHHGRPGDGRKLIVLASLPGDQHTFGLAMTAEFFRRAGWTVCRGTTDDAVALIGAAPRDAAVVYGLSASGIGQVGEIAASAHRVRTVCGKRIAGIMVGGPLFIANPDHAAAVGAEAMSADARQGVSQAESLVAGSR